MSHYDKSLRRVITTSQLRRVITMSHYVRSSECTTARQHGWCSLPPNRGDTNGACRPPNTPYRVNENNKVDASSIMIISHTLLVPSSTIPTWQCFLLPEQILLQSAPDVTTGLCGLGTHASSSGFAALLLKCDSCHPAVALANKTWQR